MTKCSFYRRTFMTCMLLTTAVMIATGCSDGEPSGGAEISIPPLPFQWTSSIDFDEARIAELASGYCDEEGEGGSSETFFLGVLPTTAIELLCESEPDDPLVPYLFGDLVVSGYFGGTWLRDSMSGPEEIESILADHSPGDTKNGIFGILSNIAGNQIELAAEGTEWEILSGAKGSLPLLLFIYGYNYGYIEVALENPPEGVTPYEDLLVCDSFLDCESPAVGFEGLERFRDTLGLLSDPPDWRWRKMAALVPRWGESAVDSGREVWEGILEYASFSESSYQTLLELSVGFLLVSDAAVLSGMTAWADRDIEAGQCAALMQAGLVVWSGSYFLGLASSEEAGTFPELTCR